MSAEVLSILALILSVLFFVYNRFIYQIDKESKYEHRFTELETKVNLYWNGVENILSKQLHSPHRPNLDAYLEKITAGTITLDERAKLRELLFGHICDQSIEPDRCTSAQLLLLIQDARIAEATIKRANSPKVLTVPAAG